MPEIKQKCFGQRQEAVALFMSDTGRNTEYTLRH